MHPLRQFITNYVEVTDSDWAEIEQYLTPIKLKKGAILLQQGKICRTLYFVEEGLLRYYIYKDGQDVTKYFTIAPYLFTSQMSFTNEKPATENIQAIENCTLWQMSFDAANQLMQLNSWNKFIVKLIQEVQYYTDQILTEVQTITAEDRYYQLLTRQPDIVARIPLKYIASYLGIAPQSLSRIRKTIMPKT